MRGTEIRSHKFGKKEETNCYMKSALLKLIKGSGNGHLLAELSPPRTSL